MKIKVVVESQSEVDAWLKSQQPVFIKKTEVVPAVLESDTLIKADTTKRIAIK